MTIARGLLAAAPSIGSATACVVLAFAPASLPEDAGEIVLNLHFAQPFLAIIALVYGESLDPRVSTRKRLAVFIICLAVLGGFGLLFAGDLLLNPMIASTLAWAVVGHALAMFVSGPAMRSEKERVLALAQDGWVFWALVSVAGAVAAGIVAFAADEPRGIWAALIPAAYFLVMAVAIVRVHLPSFADRPAALSDSAPVRAIWRMFPQSRSDG